MVGFAIEQDADLTIASLPVTENEAPRLGILKIDENWQVRDFVEKPKDAETLKRFNFKDSPTYLVGETNRNCLVSEGCSFKFLGNTGYP